MSLPAGAFADRQASVNRPPRSVIYLSAVAYAACMLQLRLFGGLAVELDGTPVDLPSSRRAWALLGWLALQPGLHQRSALAARFWPDVLDSSARASLRSATWSLRNALGAAGDRYLHASRDRLGLLPDAGLWVDAVAFGELAAAGRLAEAAALSRGDLLAGLDDEWVLEARDAHRAKLTDVLEGLAAAAQDQGDLAAALDWSRKQAALNPFAEEPVRRLMDRLVATGRWPCTPGSPTGWSASSVSPRPG